MNPILQATDIGQSFWLDYIRRDILFNGDLAAMIGSGEVRGVTSNPSIFDKAIAGSDLYSSSLRSLAQAGLKPAEAFDILAIDDIRAATDLFMPLFEQTNGGDGYVSIEVNPRLADDTPGTLEEASRLWQTVNRPNVMIKIPATAAGVPAIEQAISQGININVTLIFSLQRYTEVMEAYLRGLEQRMEAGQSLDHIASVASFFVSRVDTKVDQRLEEIIRTEERDAERATSLLGKIAIANAKLAYAQFKSVFESQRFTRLAERGARLQRPLWASTSTKNPNYPDTTYVDNLIGPNTVNTLPPETLEAFREHGQAANALEEGLSEARAQVEALEALGIRMQEVTDQLEQEGVASFARSFESLLETLQDRMLAMRRELAPILPALLATLERLKDENVAQRIWQADGSLWAQESAAKQLAANRLGWLHLPRQSQKRIPEFESLASALSEDGIEQVLWIGMGGSSLAADVLSRSLTRSSEVSFQVLDSTDPHVVQRALDAHPPQSSLFVIASKSGATTEPRMLLELFWSRAQAALGDQAGSAFVAVSDPGSELFNLAQARGFRAVVETPVDVGGRYSALSAFGLLPAAILGFELQAMLEGAARMAKNCGPRLDPAQNMGLFLGAVLAAAHEQGRDKLTLIADPALEALSDWIEQLVAESSGKQDKGWLPVVHEPAGGPEVYGDDRMMVYIRQDGGKDARVKTWIEAGLPVAVVEMPGDAAGFGEAFYRWEMAIAVACHLIGVNAFDQPNVQAAKERTQSLLDAYRKQAEIPAEEPDWSANELKVWGLAQEDRSALRFSSLFSEQPGIEVFSVLIYAAPDPQLEHAVQALRQAVRDRYNLATTFGYGPRYLHSTGQYHKGGPNNGTYLMLTAEYESKDKLEIPGQGADFGTLIRAQAIGDVQALKAAERRVVHLEVGKIGDMLALIQELLDVVRRNQG